MKLRKVIIIFTVIFSLIGLYSCFQLYHKSKQNHYEWLKQEYGSYIWELVDDIDDVKEVRIKEYDSFLIVYSPQVSNSYLLAFFVPDRDKYPYPQNNYNVSPFSYQYIIMGRLYDGGNYFGMDNEKLHLALINLQRKLYENNFSISQVYSDGMCRINYGMLQLPLKYADFSNIDSLDLVQCDRNDSCIDWIDLKQKGF